MNRRELLRMIGAAGATGAAGGVPLLRALPGLSSGSAAGQSWLDRIGLQLYTVRSRMAEDAAGTLARVADVGYREVELAGTFGHDPARLRAMLDAAGLAAPSAHVALEALEGDRAGETLDAAESLGHRDLVVGWVPAEQRRTLGDWHRLADRLQAVGSRVAEAGLHVAYHNHEFEFDPVGGRVPYEVLVEGTDPELVGLQLDLYWVRKGGGDARAWLARHPGRFPSVHVKDMAADASMADVGAGVIEWPDLLAHARDAGVRHYFVEHDHPPDPLRSIRNSYRYLRALPG